MNPVSVRVSAKGVTGRKFLIKPYRIKSRIPKKCFWADEGVSREKILQSGDEEPGIMDGLIFIRGIRFFINQDIGMLIKEVFIIKVNMAEDAQAVGDEGKFIGITEIPVNEKLFDQRIGGSMRGHGSVGGFVRIIRVIKAHGFGIRFQLPDDAVSKFGVVFLEPCLNAGTIKDGHICFGRINGLADRFRKVNEMTKRV